jgi:hypothetical protein
MRMGRRLVDLPRQAGPLLYLAFFGEVKQAFGRKRRWFPIFKSDRLKA